jgi:site-specific DNA-methyltransferase (adenine-specific)
MNKEVLFSSNTDNWSTPKWLFEELNNEFHFDMDPCPLRSLTDGLDKPWPGNIFINPPYSNITTFLEKGKQEMDNGNSQVQVFLLASRTDTKWFHKYIYKKDNVEIRFIKGRLKFGDSINSAPFPSMIVIFK